MMSIINILLILDVCVNYCCSFRKEINFVLLGYVFFFLMWDNARERKYIRKVEEKKKNEGSKTWS